MAIVTFFKKLFSGDMDDAAGSSVKSAEAPSAAPAGNGRAVSLKDLESFVNYVVTALVDYPDEVKVTTKNEDNASVIWISCRKEDTGKIIGKKGKTISALRALVFSAGCWKSNQYDHRCADHHVADEWHESDGC